MFKFFLILTLISNLIWKFVSNKWTQYPSNTINFVLTGVEQSELSKTINIYPNPVSNELIIEMKGNNKKTDFEILNSIGQVVFSGNLFQKTTVNTSKFTSGVYLIKIKNGKSFEFKKLIKN